MGVITISRQYGTGGEEVAERVAEETGYTIVGLEEIGNTLIEIADEWTAESVVAEKSPPIIERLTGDVKVSRNLLAEGILSFAMRGSVIIIGRGAFDILKGVPGVLHLLFVDARETREARVSLAEKIKLIDAREKIRKIDRERAGFLKYYFGKEWPDPSSFHLSMTPLTTGIDNCVEFVLRMVDMMDIGPSFEGKGREAARMRHLLAAIKNRVVLHAGLDIDHFTLELMDEKRIGIKFSRAIGMKVSPVPRQMRENAIKVADDFAEDYSVIQVK